MTSLLDANRVTGIVLILSFLLFAIGATLPILGEKGNLRIFTLPDRDYLTAIAGNATVWRWSNILMGIAFVVLLAGLVMFATLLEAANERVLSRLGITALLIAAVLWLVFSIYRATVPISAAEAFTTTGELPNYYPPLARWAFTLFYAYAVIAYLALAAFAVSILITGMLPGWIGWGTLVFAAALLILLFVTGDTLPAFHYVPPLIIGAVMLTGAR